MIHKTSKTLNQIKVDHISLADHQTYSVSSRWTVTLSGCVRPHSSDGMSEQDLRGSRTKWSSLLTSRIWIPRVKSHYRGECDYKKNKWNYPQSSNVTYRLNRPHSLYTNILEYEVCISTGDTFSLSRFYSAGIRSNIGKQYV